MENTNKMPCVYNGCRLRKNNSYYIWQFGYTLVGICVLFYSKNNFTFFQTFLFIWPVFLDVLDTELKTKTLNKVRIIFGGLNGIILIACLLGAGGIFQDTTDCFSVASTFLYFPGISIKKEIVGIVIALNIAVPIIFYIGTPCQKAQDVVKILQQTSEHEEVR